MHQLWQMCGSMSSALHLPCGLFRLCEMCIRDRCEPYITADYRGTMEDTDLVMAGVYTLLELLEADRVIIAIESNKPEAIRVLTEIAENKRDQKDQVKVCLLYTSRCV